MFDELDDGARTGVWVALGVVAFVLFGLIGGLLVRGMNDRYEVAYQTEQWRKATYARVLDDMNGVDTSKLPDITELVGTIAFAPDSATLPPGAAPLLADAALKPFVPPQRRLWIGGWFQDKPDLLTSREMSVRRALAVRQALNDLGLPNSVLVLATPVQLDSEPGADARSNVIEIRLAD